jgi:hypothetical protein
MRTKLIAGLAASTLAIGAPAVASASQHPTRTCSVNLTARFVEVMVNSGQPPKSGTNTGVATVDGTLCGKPFHGALRDVNHFPRFGQVDGSAVIYGPLGSIRIRFASTATINHDNSASLRGTSTITGGTGLYARATGSGTSVGQQPPNSPVTTQHLTGTIDY